MDELQLKLCDIQGRLFELSGSKGYDSVPFIKTFMNSYVAQGLDSKYNRLQWAGEEYLLAEVADITSLPKNGLIFDREVLYWCGYLYRFWHYYTNESSKGIYKQATALFVKQNWDAFHSISPDIVIEYFKELHNKKQYVHYIV